MKISFDFDDTLSKKEIQNLARILIKGGAEVWVVTARSEDRIFEDGKIIGNRNYNADVRRVCEDLGIPEERIIFTDGSFKEHTYFSKDMDFHFDDRYDEVEKINRRGGNSLLVGMSIYAIANEIDLGNLDKI